MNKKERIERLELEVDMLQLAVHSLQEQLSAIANKPPQYVPPPVYGPLPQSIPCGVTCLQD